jgi:hypothetical protein
MLGKLRTHLLDESFRAGLLLLSWHKAGLLPELEEMAQCLRDDDAAAAASKVAPYRPRTCQPHTKEEDENAGG